jgi:hypothetical protein
VFAEKNQGSWSRELVDSRPGSGMYLNMETKNEEPYIAYQDGTLGRERLRYASREDGNWSTSTVENVSNGGVSVGMYPSLSFRKQKPVILYHSPSQGLKLAERGQDWNTEILEENQGWYTDSYSCNNTIKAYYRARNKTTLMKGSYNGEWSSEDIGRNIRSDLTVTGEGCTPHIAYLDANTSSITYTSDQDQKEFSQAFFSRMSITYSENTHLLFHEPGKGLVYSNKDNGSWNTEIVDNTTETGIYNDIAVDQTGNIHTAYTSKDRLKYSKFNSGDVETRKTTYKVVRMTLVVLTAAVAITIATFSS